MCAGTGTQVCPEQTTVQLLRYGCHEYTCGPPTHPWCAGYWGGAQLTAPSSTDLISLSFEKELPTKCYLVSCKDGEAEAAAHPRWHLPKGPKDKLPTLMITLLTE